MFYSDWPNAAKTNAERIQRCNMVMFEMFTNFPRNLPAARDTLNTFNGHVLCPPKHTLSQRINTHSPLLSACIPVTQPLSHTLLRKGQSFPSQSKMPVSARVSTDTQQTERLPFSSGRVLLNAGLGGRHLPAIINYTFFFQNSRDEQLTAEPGAFKQRHRWYRSARARVSVR